MVSGRNYKYVYQGFKRETKKEMAGLKQGLKMKKYRKSLMRALSESRKGMKGA